MKSDKRHSDYRFPEFAVDGDTGDKGEKTSEATGEQLLKEAENSAYDEGFGRGRDETLLAEKNTFQPLRALLNEARERLNAHHHTISASVEQDAVHLSMAMADAIVRRHIEQNPEIIIKTIEKALEKVKGRARVRIKTNPKDCDTVKSVLPNLVSDAQTAQSIVVTADHGIEPGGCMIETDFGVIDARIHQQLSTMAKSLMDYTTTKKRSKDAAAEHPPAFEKLLQQAKDTMTVKTYGHVSKVVGLVVEANGPAVQLGCMCDILDADGGDPVAAEVLGFRERTVLMMPLEEIRSIGPGSRVVARGEQSSIMVGDRLLGRIIDGLGNPIDNKGPLDADTCYPIYAAPINPLLRKRIKEPLDMGVRSINGLLTVGCGQRMGIFAGSGVGKSVLMGMIARKSQADVNVIALIGERGRELNDFIEKELGGPGLKKSVVVVATSDHLPLVRVRGAFVATAIAEYFRDQGLNVNLMMDSLTRFAMAQREIGLALGEPPTTKGYTPSVFTLMPKLLERTGTSDHEGTITGLYTVLVEGDDMNEPIADAARSILDGHIVLSRDLAAQNHYPAIDVLRSVSRVMDDIAALQHKHNAGRLKEMLATYRKAEDLINIGAYVSGSNAGIDRAIERIDRINAYLRQAMQEDVNLESSLRQLEQIMSAD